MAEARAKDRWSHTSALMALLANVHRDPKKKPSPYRPDDFHPLMKHEDRRIQVSQREGFKLLKQVFTNNTEIPS